MSPIGEIVYAQFEGDTKLLIGELSNNFQLKYEQFAFKNSSAMIYQRHCLKCVCVFKVEHLLWEIVSSCMIHLEYIGQSNKI